MQEIRCKHIVKGRVCNRLLGFIHGKYDIQCPKCGNKTTGDTKKKESVK